MIRRLLRPEAVAVHDDLQRLLHMIEIVERLAHAHHDDIGQHPSLGRARPFAKCVARQHDLADDLRRLQVADQLHRAGMAKAAIERAPDLARHAERAAVGIGDEHHLEIMAVVGAEQPFAGSVGRHLRLDHFRPGQREALGQPWLLCFGDIGHRGKVADSAIIDPMPDLLGAELGLPWLQPCLFQRGADRLPGQANQLDLAVGTASGRARNGHGIDRAGNRHQVGIGAHGRRAPLRENSVFC